MLFPCTEPQKLFLPQTCPAPTHLRASGSHRPYLLPMSLGIVLANNGIGFGTGSLGPRHPVMSWLSHLGSVWPLALWLDLKWGWGALLGSRAVGLWARGHRVGSPCGHGLRWTCAHCCQLCLWTVALLRLPSQPTGPARTAGSEPTQVSRKPGAVCWQEGSSSPTVFPGRSIRASPGGQRSAWPGDSVRLLCPREAYTVLS